MRAGISGFQNFDAGMTTPQVVKNRLLYMTPDWKKAFQLTAQLADSLQLEMAIAGSPSWPAVPTCCSRASLLPMSSIFYGEDSNITALFGDKLPDVPEGYNYDFTNADALLTLLSVKNGHLITPSGMSYRMLALDSNSRRMSLKVARKIRDLVRAGAVVVGPKPTGTPSLADDASEFNAIVEELWGTSTDAKTVGNGKVYTNPSLQAPLADLKIAPDFEYTKPQPTSHLLFVHRKLPKQEIYWVNNRSDSAQTVEATFRVAGKTVEIWHPDNR